MTSILFSVLFVVSADLPAPEPAGDAVEVRRGLEFARYGDKAIELDLYRPRDRAKDIPCIVVIAGGAFISQKSKRFKDEAVILAEAGFAAASIGYRGWPGDTFPAAVQDAKAAVRFLRANAASLNIDPDRIGAFGQSAGAYLAAMLAVTGGEADLEGAGGNKGVSSRVGAVVCFSGLFDLVGGEGGEKEGGSIAKRAFNRLWLGAPLDEDRALWEKASPVNHITPDDAPILFVHSKKDSMVPWRQSEAMHSALEAVRPESSLLLLDKGGHNIRDNRKIKAEAWSASIAWFRERLAG